jgi:hypothetical protein
MANTRKTQETSKATDTEILVDSDEFINNQLEPEHENDIKPVNPRELFFQNQVSDSYTIAVYRLPLSHGRTDSRGGRIYCGQIQFVEYYEDEIKELFGAGEYVIELRENGKFVGRKNLFIEGETYEDKTESQPIQPPQPQPQILRPVMMPPQMPVMPNADQFKQFLAIMKEARELALTQNDTAKIQPNIGTFKDIKDNLSDLKEVAEMFGSSNSSQNSVWENLAMTLAAGALPLLQQAASKWLTDSPNNSTNQPPQPQPQIIQNPDGTFTLPNGQIVRQAFPEQMRQSSDNSNDATMTEQPEETTFDEETDMLIDELVKEMCDLTHAQGLQQDAIQRAATLIKKFREKHPLKAIFINALIQQDAELVLKQLASLYQEDVANSFYQIHWILDFIKALQTELKQ